MAFNSKGWSYQGTLVKIIALRGNQRLIQYLDEKIWVSVNDLVTVENRTKQTKGINQSRKEVNMAKKGTSKGGSKGTKKGGKGC